VGGGGAWAGWRQLRNEQRRGARWRSDRRAGAGGSGQGAIPLWRPFLREPRARAHRFAAAGAPRRRPAAGSNCCGLGARLDGMPAGGCSRSQKRAVGCRAGIAW
jgi:hypothetical protein